MENLNGVYSIFDTVAGVYGPLFEAINERVAIRNYNTVISRVNEDCKADYKLYKLGVFNAKTGDIEVFKPELISEYRSKNKE